MRASSTSIPREIRKIPALCGAAALVLLLLSAPASAQVPSLPPVDDVVGGVTGGTGGSGGTVGDTGGKVSDPVTDTGGKVGDTITDTGGKIGDTITDTGGKVGDTVGGQLGGTVKDTSGKVGDAVKEVTGSVGGAVKDTSGQVGNAVGGTADSVLGDGEGRKGDKDHGSKKEGKKERKSGDGKKKSASDDRTTQGAIDFGEGAFGFGTRTPSISLGEVGGITAPSGEQVAAFAPQPLDFGALTEAAVEAVKRFAFPILLSFLVAAFMLVQDRVDRRDPKLALAAVDPEQDWLSFA